MKLLILILLLSSCSLLWDSSKKDRIAYKAYQFENIPSDWERFMDKDVDYAYRKKNSEDLLITNSYCQAYQENDLATVTKQSLIGIQNIVIKKEQTMKFKGRQAYQIFVNGTIDGVSRNVLLLSTRRNHCYFEFTFIASSLKSETEIQKDFDSIIKSVKF